jgi:hypothetical protein
VIKLPLNSYYLIFALVMLFLLLAFVPRQEIKKLFWFSLLWGSGVDTFFVLLFRFLNLYYYQGLEPFNLLGTSILLAMSWSPAIILYIHFFPNRDEWYYITFYITAYSMIGVSIGLFFTQVGIIKEIHWNEFFRFPIHFIWFFGVWKHYQYLQSTEKKSWNN